jgi:hypothetical protein
MGGPLKGGRSMYEEGIEEEIDELEEEMKEEIKDLEERVKELEEIVEQKKAQIFYMNRAIHRLERIVYLALMKNIPPEQIEELKEIGARLDC